MTTRTDASMTLEEAVQAALDGRSNVVLCPAHDDRSPSLSVGPGRTQPVLLNCHAGCEPDAIIESGGIDWATVCNPLDMPDAVPSRDMWTPRGTASQIYPYRDAEGRLLFEVLRVPQEGGRKTFMQRRPDAEAPHGHKWNLDGVERVPYRLPEIITAVRNGRTIHIAEGEKCVHALLTVIEEGEEATCNPGGAGKWMPEFGNWFAGANVVIYADADDTGRQHARAVRDSLLEVDATVTIKEAPPGVMPGSGKSIHDIADHIEAGLGMDLLLETTPKSQIEQARTGVDILDLVRRPRGMTEFVIDRTLARGERVVLIGFEGNGKSTLCRQVAAMTAAGLHPFAGHEMEPQKVLFVDAENHPDQVLDSWATLVGLCARLDRPIERGMLTVMEEHDRQPDLTSEDGAAWLMERVHAYRPALVVMGPLTNLSNSDLREDTPVRRLLGAVDRARTVCNSAFWLEHHAPHKSPSDKQREPRPYGSSLFLKRPDYGFGMKPTDDPKVFEWLRNRGPRVRSRIWPEAIREGNGGLEFPWMETVLPEDPKGGR